MTSFTLALPGRPSKSANAICLFPSSFSFTLFFYTNDVAMQVRRIETNIFIIVESDDGSLPPTPLPHPKKANKQKRKQRSECQTSFNSYIFYRYTVLYGHKPNRAYTSKSMYAVQYPVGSSTCLCSQLSYCSALEKALASTAAFDIYLSQHLPHYTDVFGIFLPPPYTKKKLRRHSN